jgi:hypothetical protein
MKFTLVASACVSFIAIACAGKSEPNTFAEPTPPEPSTDATGRLTDPSYVVGDCEFHDSGNPWTCRLSYRCVDLSAFGVVGNTCVNRVCPVCVKPTIAEVLVCNAPSRTPNVLFTVPETFLCR